MVNPEARAALEARLPAWVGELVQKGVAERKARQLALDIPDDQPVLDQVEYAEHLIHQDRRGRGKISNPAGFFIWAIESNLSVPAEFETSRKRRIREAQMLNWPNRAETSRPVAYRLVELKLFDHIVDQTASSPENPAVGGAWCPPASSAGG